MFLVYYIAMVAVGAPATDWANDGVFGDGWHLLWIGSAEFNDADGEYGDALNESLLQSIGDIVYQDTASGTYILQVQNT